MMQQIWVLAGKVVGVRSSLRRALLAVATLLLAGCGGQPERSTPSAVADDYGRVKQALVELSSCSPSNQALNTTGSGFPSPLESDPAFSDPWALVDGLTEYPDVRPDLELPIGGMHQVTIDFGRQVTFDEVTVWHHPDDGAPGHNIPNDVTLEYFDGSQWLPISDATRNLELPACNPGETVCQGDEKHVCNADGDFVFQEDCGPNLCLDGNCVECIPGSSGCLAPDQLRFCDAAGTWGAPTVCPSGICVEDGLSATCGVCLPAERRCAGDVVQSCSAEGEWIDDEVCSIACVSDGVQAFCGECAPGDRECLGPNALQVCNATGMWLATVCAAVCATVNGVAECVDCDPGVARCVDGIDESVREICSVDGVWVVDEVCAASCVNTECGQCINGTTRCLDAATYQMCTQGIWGVSESCAAQQTCVAGECVDPACSLGTILCNGNCINPNTDPDFCGAAEGCVGFNICAPNEGCFNGECACVGGLVRCDGECINPDTDENFCGAAEDCAANPGNACALDQVCVNGECVCTSGLVVCDGECIDPTTDNNFCGAGENCDQDNGVVCLENTECVGGVCVDIQGQSIGGSPSIAAVSGGPPFLSYPDAYAFSPVSGTKLRWSYDGDGDNVLGDPASDPWQAWVHEVSVTGCPEPLISESASGSVPAGESVTTDSEGDGATSSDPVETTVTTPTGGSVSIEEGPITSEPDGFSFFGVEVDTTAPSASVANPLILEFRIDASLLPPGADENDVEVFKNDKLVEACMTPPLANPDPCVLSRSLEGDDVVITVLTTDTSIWSFAVALQSDQDGDGVLDGYDECPGTEAGETADAEGCSIDQLCPCAGPRGSGDEWRNHGRYVACVARATHTFRRTGLISRSSAARPVLQAARSTCGEKGRR